MSSVSANVRQGRWLTLQTSSTKELGSCSVEGHRGSPQTLTHTLSSTPWPGWFAVSLGPDVLRGNGEVVVAVT